MSTPSISHNEEGDLVLDNLAPWFLAVLMELPDLLAPNQGEAVERRLYPEPADDAGVCEDWDRFVRPELFALVASAREIVTKDLVNLRPADAGGLVGSWRMSIPRAHVNAWISALNAARLTLGSRHEIEERDLNDEEEPDEWNEKNVAVAKIHLLGGLQQLIVEDQSPPPEEGNSETAGPRG